jgi:hypothetical protein
MVDEPRIDINRHLGGLGGVVSLLDFVMCYSHEIE